MSVLCFTNVYYSHRPSRVAFEGHLPQSNPLLPSRHQSARPRHLDLQPRSPSLDSGGARAKVSGRAATPIQLYMVEQFVGAVE